jgi:hypothetical protein
MKVLGAYISAKISASRPARGSLLQKFRDMASGSAYSGPQMNPAAPLRKHHPALDCLQ